MAGRIRSIKPELREHTPYAELSDGAARLFLMLYTLVDDEGRCPASAGYLAGAVFFAKPRAANIVGRYLGELERAPLVRTYVVKSSPYLEILGWHERGSVTHQRIEKPQPARYPGPESIHSRNGSGNDSRNVPGRTPDLLPGPQTSAAISDRTTSNAGAPSTLSDAGATGVVSDPGRFGTPGGGDARAPSSSPFRDGLQSANAEEHPEGARRSHRPPGEKPLEFELWCGKYGFDRKSAKSRREWQAARDEWENASPWRHEREGEL